MKWTKKEVELLEEHYTKLAYNEELAIKLNRTVKSIQKKANKLGLKRDKKWFSWNGGRVPKDSKGSKNSHWNGGDI